MLRPVHRNHQGARVNVCEVLRYSDRVPLIPRMVAEELAAEYRWLSELFRAAEIVQQIPGGMAYRYEESGDGMEELITECGRNGVFCVLAACLDRLNVPELMAQVPGGRKFRREGIPAAIRKVIDERDRNGRLNVVAECLDRLLVVPTIEEYRVEEADDEEAEDEEAEDEEAEDEEDIE
jgi:hypothetical protein